MGMSSSVRRLLLLLGRCFLLWYFLLTAGEVVAVYRGRGAMCMRSIERLVAWEERVLGEGGKVPIGTWDEGRGYWGRGRYLTDLVAMRSFV